MPWQDTKSKDKTKNLFLYKKFANVYLTVTLFLILIFLIDALLCQSYN